jgi:hypothetical protein
MSERPKFSEILRNGAADNLRNAWANTQAAEELAPLPRGEYVAFVVSGEPHTAKTGTVGYKLTFRVAEGEYKDRRFWADLWLTPAALPFTRRDLAKIGITAATFEELLTKLDRPLPQGIKVRAKLALRKEDDGTEQNKVIAFAFVDVETDPFAAAAANGSNK